MASELPPANVHARLSIAWLSRVFTHPSLALFCRVALGIVFIAAGLPKTPHPQLFLINVRGYMLLPDLALPSFTVILPMVEVVAGACLVTGVWVRPSALLAGALLAMFLIGMAAAMARGLDIECDCFGRGGAKVGPAKIAEDLAMLLMLIPIFSARRQVARQ